MSLMATFPIPDAWFQKPQFDQLYEVLKGLIGVDSVSAGSPKESIILKIYASVQFLFYSQPIWSKNADIGWLESFVWKIAGTEEIMAHKNEGEAKAAIRAMGCFLERVGLRGNGSGQVLKCIVVMSQETTSITSGLILTLTRLGSDLARTAASFRLFFGARWGTKKGRRSPPTKR